MIVRGCLGSDPEKVTPKSGGNPYWTFRLGENHGKGENRITVWYDVVAVIPDSVALQFGKGSAVEIDGRLDASGYISQKRVGSAPVPGTWSEVARLLRSVNALQAGLKLLTMSAKPYQFEEHAHAPTSSAPAAAPAPVAPDLAAVIAAAVAQAIAAARG